MNQKIKNPNSSLNRFKRYLLNRWSDSELGLSEKQIQPHLIFKDLFLFFGLPMISIVLFKMVETSSNKPRKTIRAQFNSNKDSAQFKIDLQKSQIIHFDKTKSGLGSNSSKLVGTLVKVKLLNYVETFGSTPVHVRILDTSLGQDWYGGTLIGEAISDPSVEKISISFNIAKNRDQTKSFQMQARALSLNGTLGIDAEKKEGFFARSAISGSKSINNPDSGNDTDVKSLLIRALANGLLQEASNSGTVAQNKSQVLTLKSGEIFFAELTDNFPLKN